MNWTRKLGRRRAALLITVVVLMLFAAFVAGCGGSSGGASGDASASPSGDQPVFRLGSVGDPYDSLNPFVANFTSSWTALMFLYPNLVQYSSDLEVQPEFAESWTVSDDGKTWTFKLRSGAVWTDGEPITAADAAFTIDTVLKFKDDVTAFLSTLVPTVKDAEAVDDTTLVLTLTAPSAALLSDMYFLPIVPEHVWAPLAAGDGAKLKTPTMDPSKETVVVSGPFTIEKLDVKGTTIFKRVDTYYGEKPLITGYGFQLFSNADAAVQALKADEIDCAYFLPASSTAAFDGQAQFKVQGFGELPWFVAVNDSENYTKHPELREPAVREALSLATDRSAIIETVNRGFATSGGWPLIPGYAPQYMTEPMPVPDLDVAKANELLDGLGYAKGSDGIRVADGVKMSYEILVYAPFRATDGRTADLLRENFAAIGVELEQKLLDDPYTAMWANDYTDYAMLLTGWGLSPDPNGSLILSTSALLGSSNPTGYSNPTYDKLFDEQSAETDPAKRKAIIDEMAGLLEQDQVYLPLYGGQIVTAWNAKWTGVEEMGSALGFYMPLRKSLFDSLAVQQ
jgi:peptide/nickel transport system substrate-binding protein